MSELEIAKELLLQIQFSCKEIAERICSAAVHVTTNSTANDGDDIFVFGGNWGNDKVYQSPGTVTLWFDREVTRTANSDNEITVQGGASMQIEFKTGYELKRIQ